MGDPRDPKIGLGGRPTPFVPADFTPDVGQDGPASPEATQDGPVCSDGAEEATVATTFGRSHFTREPPLAPVIGLVTPRFSGTVPRQVTAIANPSGEAESLNRRLAASREVMLRFQLDSFRGAFSPENIRLVANLLVQTRYFDQESTTDQAMAVHTEVEKGGAVGFARFIDEILEDNRVIHRIAADKDTRLFLSLVPWTPSNGLILASPFNSSPVPEKAQEGVFDSVVGRFTAGPGEIETETDGKVRERVRRWFEYNRFRFGSGLAVWLLRHLPDYYGARYFVSDPELEEKLLPARRFQMLAVSLELMAGEIYATKFPEAERVAPVVGIEAHPAFKPADPSLVTVTDEIDPEEAGIVDGSIDPGDQERVHFARVLMLRAHLMDIRDNPTPGNIVLVAELVGAQRLVEMTGAGAVYRPQFIFEKSIEVEVRQAAEKGKFGEIVDALAKDPAFLAVAAQSGDYARFVPWAPRRPLELLDSPFGIPPIDDADEIDEMLRSVKHDLVERTGMRESVVQEWLDRWIAETTAKIGINAMLDVVINLPDVYAYRQGDITLAEEVHEAEGVLNYPPVLRVLDQAVSDLRQMKERGRLVGDRHRAFWKKPVAPVAVSKGVVGSVSRGVKTYYADHPPWTEEVLGRLKEAREAMVRAQLSINGSPVDEALVAQTAADQKMFTTLVPWAESDNIILNSPFGVAVEADIEAERYNAALESLAEPEGEVSVSVRNWFSGWYHDARVRLGPGAALAVAEVVRETYRAALDPETDPFWIESLKEGLVYAVLSSELNRAVRQYAQAVMGVGDEKVSVVVPLSPGRAREIRSPLVRSGVSADPRTGSLGPSRREITPPPDDGGDFTPVARGALPALAVPSQWRPGGLHRSMPRLERESSGPRPGVGRSISHPARRPAGLAGNRRRLPRAGGISGGGGDRPSSPGVVAREILLVIRSTPEPTGSMPGDRQETVRRSFDSFDRAIATNLGTPLDRTVRQEAARLILNKVVRIVRPYVLSQRGVIENLGRLVAIEIGILGGQDLATLAHCGVLRKISASEILRLREQYGSIILNIAIREPDPHQIKKRAAELKGAREAAEAYVRSIEGGRYGFIARSIASGAFGSPDPVTRAEQLLKNYQAVLTFVRRRGAQFVGFEETMAQSSFIAEDEEAAVAKAGRSLNRYQYAERFVERYRGGSYAHLKGTLAGLCIMVAGEKKATARLQWKEDKRRIRQVIKAYLEAYDSALRFATNYRSRRYEHIAPTAAKEAMTAGSVKNPAGLKEAAVRRTHAFLRGYDRVLTFAKRYKGGRDRQTAQSVADKSFSFRDPIGAARKMLDNYDAVYRWAWENGWQTYAGTIAGNCLTERNEGAAITKAGRIASTFDKGDWPGPDGPPNRRRRGGRGRRADHGFVGGGRGLGQDRRRGEGPQALGGSSGVVSYPTFGAVCLEPTPSISTAELAFPDEPIAGVIDLLPPEDRVIVEQASDPRAAVTRFLEERGIPFETIGLEGARVLLLEQVRGEPFHPGLGLERGARELRGETTRGAELGRVLQFPLIP